MYMYIQNYTTFRDFKCHHPGPCHIISRLDYFKNLPTGILALPLVPYNVFSTQQPGRPCYELNPIGSRPAAIVMAPGFSTASIPKSSSQPTRCPHSDHFPDLMSFPCPPSLCSCLPVSQLFCKHVRDTRLFAILWISCCFCSELPFPR